MSDGIASHPEAKSPPLVLLVDDLPANLFALESLLEPLPIRTMRASSGAEALRLLLKHEFAVVLLDVQMPNMDGFEVAAQMRAHPRTASVPIIFITAISRDAKHVYEGYEKGAVDYILKPFDPVVLKAKVNVFVDLFMKQETIKQQAKLLRERELEALDRKMERRYRKLADAMPAFVWASRPDGGVYYVNRAWSEFSGLDAEETASFVPARAVHPEDLDAAKIAWELALKTRGPFEVQYRLKQREDGTYRWYLVRSSVELGENGAIDGFVATATDIDAEKEIAERRERMLQVEQDARIAAESANRTKDEFLANVSHELRSPLNVILGWTHILRQGSLEGERQAHAIEVIERSARGQVALVEDLLDVSRIASGKLLLNRTKVDATQIAREAAEALRPTAERRGIALGCTGGESRYITADSDRLSQIISNLISNALKFTKKDGRVDVSIENGDGTVKICVRDTGIGISQEFLPHVFERFRQEDSSASRTHSGLGIGLAIVQHLVELHGGSVRADSEGINRGATFTVELPAVIEENEQESRERGDPREASAV